MQGFTEDRVLALLQSLSNPVRKGIVEALGKNKQAAFSALLVMCDLDVYYQKGLLDYHLKQLSRLGIVAKQHNGYSLTEAGTTVACFLRSLEDGYRALFAAGEPRPGGEIVDMSVKTFEAIDAEEVSMARHGTKGEAKNESLWATGNRVPLKAMGWEWGRTVSFVARTDAGIVGVLYGNTVPMHVSDTPARAGEPLAVVQPTAERPANRLEGEVFDIWIRPDYEGRGVEKELVKGFVEIMKKQGAIAVSAERVLTENEALVTAFEGLGFQKVASYQDFKLRTQP